MLKSIGKMFGLSGEASSSHGSSSTPETPSSSPRRQAGDPALSELTRFETDPERHPKLANIWLSSPEKIEEKTFKRGRTKEYFSQSRSDRLYQTKNIIGSTQAPGVAPTVYYRSDSGAFGHITQEHSVLENIGRQPPAKDPNYYMGNIAANNTLFEVMTDGDHKSRSTFKLVANQQELDQLAQAHERFTSIKPLYKK